MIVKDNKLINASYFLELIEQRLILMAIIAIRKRNSKVLADTVLTINAKDYSELFDVTESAAYQALKEACKTLFERRFSYNFVNENGNNEKVTSRWVSEIRYVKKTGCVKLIFAPAVIPFITQLEKCFTSYDIEQVRKLTSFYAIRLYEIIIAWRTTGKVPPITLSELRTRLGIGETEYQKMSNFKNRVFDNSIAQINEFTDINVTYEQHKEGRTVSGFTFKFQQKENLANEQQKINIQQNEPKKLTDKQIPYFADMLAKDSDFGSKFAQAGESSKDFYYRIIRELSEPNKVAEWQDWIKKYDKMSKSSYTHLK